MRTRAGSCTVDDAFTAYSMCYAQKYYKPVERAMIHILRGSRPKQDPIFDRNLDTIWTKFHFWFCRFSGSKRDPSMISFNLHVSFVYFSSRWRIFK
jgi:hypothetical protein